MTNPVDHEAVQAAQALCMLAVDTRQQDVDDDETEDEDCIIMHARPVVRPVVQRHHPYRRPEPQRVGVPVPRSRGMSPNAEAERMEIVREYLHRDKWNVFPLEQHEMQPGAPVPEVRRVVRNGAAVPEKVPLPHMQPSGVPRSTPVEHPTPARRPLPDRRPSPSQPPTRIEDDAPPAKKYSFKSLAFQALLARPEGQWVSTSDVTDYVAENFPEFRDRDRQNLRHNLRDALFKASELLERSEPLKAREPNQWRVPDRSREAAALIAWKTKPSALFSQSAEAMPPMPYGPKSLTLQALLAAPEGQWMHSSDLVDYLTTQYPQLLGMARSGISKRVGTALHNTDLVENTEKFVQLKKRIFVYWRLLPGVRQKATRLAWPDKSVQNATH